MRIRLLMDTTMDSDEIAELAELLEEQPASTVQISGHRLLGARFMGAQPVMGEEHE